MHVFVAVAETGAISRAAERLLVSQSSVSLALTELERSLRTTLCVRRRAHGVQLTPAGEAVLTHARLLLHQAAELEAAAAGGEDTLTGRLSLGCYPTVGPTVLPTLLQGFTSQYPDVEVTFHEDVQDQLQRRLEGGELDLVIVYDLDLPPQWGSRPLLERRPGVLLPCGHRLAADPGPLDLRELAEEPMVLLDTTPSSAHAADVCSRAGFSPRISYRSQNYETVRALVGRGLGWTIMLQRPGTATTYEGLEVVFREIATPEPEAVRLVVAWPHEGLLSRVARSFVRYAGEQFTGTAER
ncbi:LysR substrate-binding domain-containing protein [Streptomyces sp. KR55]|uniref:LysR substrate-binding domain-containing protein n=1 Tax=Streptomyces sp. KR55 TaxID=3457425 RepID=UPI003FD0E1AF